MNGIYAWALSFTVCSFTVLIISYLFPKGNVKNTAVVVLVLYCLLSIISPIKEIKGIDLHIENESVTQTEYTSEISAAKTRIRLMTDEALENIGINNYELELDISLNDGELQINKYKIYVESSDFTETAKNAVTKSVGTEPEIGLLEKE